MRRLFFYGMFLLGMLASAWGVDNPLPALLDGSVVRHNGRYFGMEGGTNGVMLTSDNLLDWQSEASVLESSDAGPYELVFHNGWFYLHVPTRGNAAATSPAGPFSPVGGGSPPGEELRLYQDPAGSLYAFSRMGDGPDGGEIWTLPLAAPWIPSADAQRLLTGRRGMWDSMDQAGVGAPDVLAYRGNYYLLYAANASGPRTGRREIGVAMARSPEEFANAGKRADPVLLRNTERLARTYTTLLPTAEYAGWTARYRFNAPAPNWVRPGVKTVGWRSGSGGFGSPDRDGDIGIPTCRTSWTTGNLWVHRTFNLAEEMLQTPVLKLRHEGAVQVFLNGEIILESTNALPAYSHIELSQDSEELFREGENVLAVRAMANRTNDFRFLDYGLFDAGNHPVEPTVCGLDAPRVIEGPNGFEKWLTYRAYWNGEPGSGLDRIFFFGEEMVVDGPTTAMTPGYHPPPSRPTFFDGFDTGAAAWQCEDGEWVATNGVFRLTRTRKRARAMLRRDPAVHYLFEANLRLPENGRGKAGVVAYDDGKRQLLVEINPARNSWEYRIVPGGSLPKTYRLPPGFRWAQSPPGVEGAVSPLHRLRIVKNGGYFDVMLDDFKLTARRPILTDMTGAGVPGVYGLQSGVEFDSVTYTLGWDEHDARITGWAGAADGTHSGGTWQHRKGYGLEQTRAEGAGRAFKGELLDQYEFTVNARADSFAEAGCHYGIFPVYTDPQNYLMALIDTAGRKLVVSGKLEGKPVGPFEKPLARRIPHRHLHDISSDALNVAAWIYALRSPSVITGFDVRWMEEKNPHLQREFFIPSAEILVRYATMTRGPGKAVDTGFYDTDQSNPAAHQSGVLNPITIRPASGNHTGFGFYNFSASLVPLPDAQQSAFGGPAVPAGIGEIIGHNSGAASGVSARPLETLVRVEVESSYFFRCVKLKDRVVIELNGQPMLEVEGAWPASQVGLLTDGQSCAFDSMTLMHRP